jgi:hypothetical protein
MYYKMHEYIIISVVSLICAGGGACYFIKCKNDQMKEKIALLDVSAYERIDR